MMWRIALAGFLTLCFAVLGPLVPRAQFNGCPAGFCSLVAPSGGGGGCTPVACLGDVVSGATLYYSLARCYSFAYAGSAFDLIDSATGVTETTAKCSGGVLTFTGGTGCSPNGKTCATFAAVCGTACQSLNLYNQAGTTPCAAADTGCTIANATRADLPTYVANCTTGGKPCVQCSAASGSYMSSITSFNSISQPYTMSMVFNRTTVNNPGVFWAVASAAENFGSTANNMNMYAGTTRTFTANDNAQHRLQAIYATSPSAYLDGSSNALASVGSGAAVGVLQFCARGNATQNWTGNLPEVALYPLDFSLSSNTNAAAVDANQNTFY
jgi:hypothetical protein